MSPLVDHITPPEEDSEVEVQTKEASMHKQAEADIESAKKQSKIPFLDKLQKVHEQWFYVLDANGRIPSSFSPSDYPGIKESAIRLPATQDSLVTIEHVFMTLRHKCSVINLERTRDVTVTIKEDGHKKPEIVKGVIIFRIKTHTEPRKR